MKTKRRSTNMHPHTRKRFGHHQKRSKKFHHVYLPYLPLVISIVASIVISGWSPKGRTLAYATNTSVSGLLAATNSQRSANGQASLALNQQLSNAAQAKANDMVARNYWSHNTPDGQEPWVFVDAAGYKYLKAGENLAYGFSDSDSTVTGWMNSPSHRTNMLDSAFTDVGFGFANSANYNNSGPETVVVAMYGKPQTLAASNQAAPASSPAPAAAQQPVAAPSAPESNTPAAPVEETKPEETKPQETAFTTNTPGLEPIGQSVSRVETIAGGPAPWAVFAVGIVIGVSVMAMLTKHGLAVRRLMLNSEQFVLHHPLFDSTVIGLIVLGITLIQTVGFIK